MNHPMLPRAAGVCFVLWLALLVPTAPAAQGPGKVLDVSPSSTRELREWDTETAAMIRSGELQVRQIRADTLLPGRMTRRADQYYKGIRVFGGNVVLQLQRGVTTSLFGTRLHRHRRQHRAGGGRRRGARTNRGARRR